MNSYIMPEYGAVPVGDLPDSIGANNNPDPIILEETDIMVNDFLSPGKLQEITGREDLENVKMVEMVVNTTETTLGNFGNYLPNLRQLKLSNSVIPSVRDIGTSLSHLNVLWMSCCGLHDVDGIASMISLTELYLAYNDIEDISPISFLDNLQVLDLEGNRISDQEQFDYLSLLSKLRTLSLSGNPICQILNKKVIADLESSKITNDNQTDAMSYKESVMKKIPQLKYLDDEKFSSRDSGNSYSSSDHQTSLATSSLSQEDIDLITNAIKEGLISEEETTMYTSTANDQPGKHNAVQRPGSAGLRRPQSAIAFESAGPITNSYYKPLSRPMTAMSVGRSGSAGALRAETILQKAANSQRPSSSGSGDINLQDESSTLTFGDVICGNPIRALRSRKTSPMPVIPMLKMDDQPKQNVYPVRPATAATFRNVHDANVSHEICGHSKNDVFEELKEWRVKHEERLSSIPHDIQILNLEDRSLTVEVPLDSDTGSDSEADEILDLDAIPGLQDDNNNISVNKSQSNRTLEEVYTSGANTVLPVHDVTRLGNQSSHCRSQMRSPPPKNLSPPSLTSPLSPRNSPVSPISPIFSSSQLDGSAVPVLRGSPKNRTPPSGLQSKVMIKHFPAPPKFGAPRPKTAADFRNLHLRRSLNAVKHETLAPSMELPQAVTSSKRRTSNEVKP